MISIEPGAMKALVLTAAKKDVRYYLNGVYLEPAKGHLVSTDGHRLTLLALSPTLDVPSKIIPLDICKMAAASKNTVQLGIEENVIVIDGNTIRFTPIDGKYPDYLRAIPNIEEFKAGNQISNSYRAQYVLDMQKAYSFYLAEKLETYPTHEHKDKPICAIFGTGFVSLVMAVRCDEVASPDASKYAWVGGPNNAD